MNAVVYDTGALLAAERRDAHLWALHDETLARDIVPVVPVVVLAQRAGTADVVDAIASSPHCFTGPRSSPVNRATSAG